MTLQQRIDSIKQVSEESSRLMRGELKLAQAEMTDKAKTAGVGIAAFGAAAVLGWFALGCFLATAILALALVLPPLPTDTVDSVKQDVQEIKESARR